jgi:hypothetical protein
MALIAWLGVLAVGVFLAFLALRTLPYRGAGRDAMAFWLVLVVLIVWGAMSAHWLIETKVT